MKQHTIPLAIVLAFAATVQARPDQTPAPFGLRMGAPRGQVLSLVRNYKETQPGFFQVQQVPEGDPDIEAYGLVISPRRGLCKIMAVGKDIPLTETGERLRDAFAKTARQLDARYGAHETFDYLRPGSLRHDPEEWTEALFRQERVLAAVWTLPPTSTIASILVEGVASGPAVGYLQVNYESPSFPACREELARAERTAIARE